MMPVSMYVIVVAGPHRNRKQLKAVMVGLGRYLNGNKDERISSTYSMLARKKSNLHKLQNLFLLITV